MLLQKYTLLFVITDDARFIPFEPKELKLTSPAFYLTFPPTPRVLCTMQCGYHSSITTWIATPEEVHGYSQGFLATTMENVIICFAESH